MAQSRRRERDKARRTKRAGRVVRTSEVPQSALDAMSQAYLIVLRAVHAQAVGPIQDARTIKIPAIVLRLIERALRSLVSHVTEDLKEIPGIQPSKLLARSATVGAFRKRNVGLIKTIARVHLTDVDRTVRKFGNMPHNTLIKKLEERFHVAQSRAKFWAVDQTLKLNADVTRSQHERLGIESYVWRTSKDGDVRPDHAALDGRTFRYDDPPIVDKRTGRRENPGKDYRCRCHADPILPEV